jgi:uncharacterized protein
MVGKFSRPSLKERVVKCSVRTMQVTVVLAGLTLAILGRAADEHVAPILKAIETDNVQAVRALLDADGSQIDARDDKGRGVVFHALFASPDPNKGFVLPKDNALVQLLLARHAALDLYEACAVGSAEQVRTMLASDPALARARASIGWTGLHFAAFGGSDAVIALLLEHGAVINDHAHNRFRNTPLAVALLTGQYSTVKMLLEAGADPNARQAGGIAPVHEAALSGRRDLIDLLLEHDAEIAVRANDGRNAVSEALRGHHPELAAYLRTRGGSDPNITADLMAEPKD